MLVLAGGIDKRVLWPGRAADVCEELRGITLRLGRGSAVTVKLPEAVDIGLVAVLMDG